ncbi:MAG: tyrosine-type recombinase/integrase [Methanospirillum sp.]
MSTKIIAVGKAPATDYLDLFDTSTARPYRHSLSRFFACVYGDRPADLDATAAEYLREIKEGARDPADDLVHAIAKLKKSYAPSTVNLTRAALTGFLLENKIEFSRVDERRIQIRSPRKTIVAEEETFTRDHLKKLLPILAVRDRAVLLVLLSSGGRMGEVFQLRISDVDLDATPARVNFRRETTKTKTARFSFITPEAVDAVKGWLLVRDKYLKASINKNRGLVALGRAKDKDPDDDRLFPFHRTSFDTAWASALQRAGLDRRCETTGRHTLHPHGLRKAFRSWFGAAAGPDAAEVLMGHTGYMETYRKYTEEDLRQVYLKHGHALNVNSDTGELASQVADLQKQNAVLEQRLNIVLTADAERKSASEQIWSDPRLRAEFEEMLQRAQARAV